MVRFFDPTIKTIMHGARLVSCRDLFCYAIHVFRDVGDIPILKKIKTH